MAFSAIKHRGNLTVLRMTNSSNLCFWSNAPTYALKTKKQFHFRFRLKYNSNYLMGRSSSAQWLQAVQSGFDSRQGKLNDFKEVSSTSRTGRLWDPRSLHQMEDRRFLLEGKAAEEWNWPLTSMELTIFFSYTFQWLGGRRELLSFALNCLMC